MNHVKSYLEVIIAVRAKILTAKERDPRAKFHVSLRGFPSALPSFFLF